MKNLKSRLVVVPGESWPKQVAAKLMDVAGAILPAKELLPPFSMRRTIGESKWQLWAEEFKVQGHHFATKLVEDAELCPASKVLDLGSGCGRLALPLTKIIAPPGEYVGMEPMRRLQQWCSQQITPRFPNFTFLHFDLSNSLYNPGGRLKAESFRFPLEAAHFTLIVATSVFTHLTPREVENYAAQCARVLQPGGKLFASFFLIENGTRGVSAGLEFAFPLEAGVARVVNQAIPEQAVAYHADWLLSLFRTHRMQLIPPIRWGCWTGRQPSYSGQDVLILEKLP